MGGRVSREVPHLRNGLEMVFGALPAGGHGDCCALPALRRVFSKASGLDLLRRCRESIRFKAEEGRSCEEYGVGLGARRPLRGVSRTESRGGQVL